MRLPWLLLSLVLVPTGCAPNPAVIHKALVQDRTPAAHGDNLEAQYLVGSPDVLEVTVRGRDDWCGQRRVLPDGRIALSPDDLLRVEGMTVIEAGRKIADRAGLPYRSVSVAVAQYNSQHVYLFGEFSERHRVVPYRGPETVVDLLQRIGGISPGASPGAIQIVRSHVADGGQPEVFDVDLEAIVLKKDQSTNVRLQAFDQVYIGRSRQWNVRNSLPPWVRPLYEQLAGLHLRPSAGVSRGND